MANIDASDAFAENASPVGFAASEGAIDAGMKPKCVPVSALLVNDHEFASKIVYASQVQAATKAVMNVDTIEKDDVKRKLANREKAVVNLRKAEDSASDSICLCLGGRQRRLVKLAVRRAEEDLHRADEDLRRAEGSMQAEIYDRRIALKVELARLTRSESMTGSHGSLSEENLANTFIQTVPCATSPWKTPLDALMRQSNLRTLAVLHSGYCEERKHGAILEARCQLTGIIGDRTKVAKAYLLSQNAPAHFFAEYKVDIHGARNMIMLSSNIKEAFDNLELCFLVDPNHPGRFVLRIWREKTRHKLLFESDKVDRTIGQFEGQAIEFEGNEMPHTNVLSLHAQSSYTEAKKQGWIKNDVAAPDQYGSPLDCDTPLRVLSAIQLDHALSDLTGASLTSSTSPQ